MKFSIRQILASAAGATLAAVLASFFGVKGTVVGAAIGSVAATCGTVFVAQSIERGHKAVKQVVVNAPESSTLLRRLGGTRAVGQHEASPTEETPATEHSPTTAVQSEATVAMEGPGPDAEPVTTQMPRADHADTAQILGGAMLAAADPATARMKVPGGAHAAPTTRTRRMRWPLIAVTAAGVFGLALVTITAVELIAGHPLSDLVGGPHTKSNSPSVVQFGNTPATTSTTTSTSTTTTSTSTTTTSSTTTTVPGESTTTTTGSGGTTTTSNGLGGILGTTTTTSTTTTIPG